MRTLTQGIIYRPRQFGFVADNFAHNIGTQTFDFSGDPMYPNFVRNGANYSWTPACSKTGYPAGVRTETPLGPMCCAPGEDSLVRLTYLSVYVR